MHNSSGAHSVHSGQQHKDRIEDHFNTQNVYPHFGQGSQRGRSWHQRPRSPGLKWHKEYNTPESLKDGRVLLIDYVKQDHSKEGMRKVAAQEINNIEGLRKLYANQDRGAEAVLRVFHVQNAWWATQFLLRKFNIKANDNLIGTDFGLFVKQKGSVRRGGKPFLSGKSWKTTHDPWRGISRTSFGVDYLKPYKRRNNVSQSSLNEDGKLMELNSYDEDDNSDGGWDVFVQRLSCYIQQKTAPMDTPSRRDIDNPYNVSQGEQNPHQYIPRLDSLDNGSTIIVFETSHTGSIEDTLITARQQWESRWRRLPFYLAFDHEDIFNDERMATECMKIILQDIWKSITETWEGFLEVCNNHMSILEDKIYDGPADETRAPELWINSSMWLKVERLISIHSAVLKEMQSHLGELSNDPAEGDDWLESSTGDMERLSNLVQEDLVKPTASLADLMYKSVEIRDSRHSLQLNTSLWRLSWITFIFLPLTFIVGFFGMNVDTFSGNPSIKWYFITAVPMMVFVFIFWYFIKHFLARRRQTPYQRGIYESLFHELAIKYPHLWSHSGPRDVIRPQGYFNRARWNLILYWNSPEKTIKAGPVEDSEYDGLGVWSRCKRILTRRWTSQIRKLDRGHDDASASTLEDGSNEDHLVGGGIGEVTELITLPVTENAENLPGGMLKIPVPPPPWTRPQSASSRAASVERPGSKGSSAQRNSGVIVEEERPTWLRDLGENGQ